MGHPLPGPQVAIHPGPVVMHGNPQIMHGNPQISSVPGTGQPVVLMKSPTKPMGNTKANCLLGMGITQVVMGSLAFIANIIATASMSSMSAYVGPGFWCGIMYIIAGAFGIVGGKKRTNGFLVTFMVLSIISSVITTGIITTAAISLSMGDYYYYDYEGVGVATDSILLICGITELVIAIISSAMCCSVVFCQNRQYVACPVQYQPGTTAVTIGQPIQGQFTIGPQTLQTA